MSPLILHESDEPSLAIVHRRASRDNGGVILEDDMKQNYWLPNPELHDFPAALDYLELLYPPPQAARLVAALKRAPTIVKKAKDVLRASGLPLLDQSNVHVKENVRKVRKGKKLSPVLLVEDGRLIIADGYHRMCAIYALSEDLEVPCRLVHAR